MHSNRVDLKCGLTKDSPQKSKASTPLALLLAMLWFACANNMLRTGVSTFGTAIECRISGECTDAAARKAANLDAGTFINAAFAVPNLLSIFATPILSSLSDKVGRKPILMWSLSFQLFSAIGWCVFAFFDVQKSFIWLVMAVSGIGGMGSTFQAVAFGLAADCSCPEYRARTFRLLQGANFLGVALGPPIVGSLGQLGPRAASIAPLVVFGLGIVSLMCIKEGEKESWSKVSKEFNLLAPFKNMYRCFFSSSTSAYFAPAKMWYICLLMGTWYISALNIPINRSLYLQRSVSPPPSTFSLSCLLASDYVTGFLYTAVLIPLTARALNVKGSTPEASPKDRARYQIRIVQFAGLAMTTAMLLYAFMPASVAAFYGISTFGGLYNVALPAFKTLASCIVDNSQQGVAMGTLSVTQTLVQLVSPVVVGTVYAHTVAWWAPFFFTFLAGASACYFLLTLRLKVRDPVTSQPARSFEGEEGASVAAAADPAAAVAVRAPPLSPPCLETADRSSSSSSSSSSGTLVLSKKHSLSQIV